MKSEAQEIFEKVVYHLFAQGKQSARPAQGDEDPGSFCLYRGPGGTKCAVGALMPDEVYSPKMENICSSSLILEFPQIGDTEFGRILDVHWSLLARLQSIHDQDSVWGDSHVMSEALINVGDNLGLSVTFIDGCYFNMVNPYGQ